jgi:type IV pilus assembly protein PilQ
MNMESRMRGMIWMTLLAVLAAGGAVAEGGLEAGDLVHVRVHRQPDLSTSVSVDGNGAVEIPYVGRVNVRGLSEEEAGARVQEALKAILKNPRVSLSRNAALQGPGASFRSEGMQTKLVPLSNSSAEGLNTALAGMASEGGSVSFDPNTNTLILTDTPSALQEMLAVVHELDQMQSQVAQIHIETKIAEVESGAIKELGVKWFTQGDHLGGGFNTPNRQDTRVDAARGGYDPLFNERIDSDNGRNTGGAGRRFLDEGNWDRRLQIPLMLAAPGQMYLGYLNEGIDLGVMIDALVGDNQAELLAAPYIRTVNHKSAQIKMVEEYPFTELGTAGLSTVANVRFIDVGITLDVTPHVRRDPDGVPYVQLEMEPEVSTATGLSNGVPIRSVRSSRSVANVRNGQTLAIGGILQNDVRNVEQKVPGIGNMPVLGRLFRHTERSKGARELMIFVTPTIYERPENATWERTLNLKEVAAGSDFLAGLESRAEQRKD